MGNLVLFLFQYKAHLLAIQTLYCKNKPLTNEAAIVKMGLQVLKYVYQGSDIWKKITMDWAR